MPDGFHNREDVLATNIRHLLTSLRPPTYDRTASKTEYWIEYVITERFTTPKDLAERVSSVAWNFEDNSDIPRFLQEFRNAPHRSEQMRSFVDELCLHALRWFAVASADSPLFPGFSVTIGGGGGFVRAASFVAHLIERGLLDHGLVRRHLKSLTAHCYNDRQDDSVDKPLCTRANAIYRLFTIAGKTLLQGLLEPEDVRDCLETLERRVPFGTVNGMDPPDPVKLNEFREVHSEWLQNRKKEEEKEEGKATPAEVPVREADDTPIAFVPKDLPTVHIGVNGDPQAAQPPSTPFSPTLSVSTTSDLTPSEFGEDPVEGNGEQTFTTTHHERFYLEDGDIEIICGHTIFRVHSPIVSFSSPIIRDILSESTLVTPRSQRCPRVVFEDSAEDFAVLLKMIYTPGFPTWPKVPEFKVFASLLRMATKYGFSDVREQLFHILKGAYPTKWEAYQTTDVLGEDIFGLPKPHLNEVLNLFLEQRVKFAIPLASYRAALGGFSSLLSNRPGATLPRLPLAFTIYGMDTIRSEVSQFAHSIVCIMGLKECHDEGCVVNGGVSPPDQRLVELNQVYDALVKDGRGDVFSFSLGGIVCVNCAEEPEQAYRLWCTMIWEDFPRIFGVGESWEAI